MTLVGAIVGAAGAWLLTLCGVVRIVWLGPGLGWDRVAFGVLLCASPFIAAWTTRHLIVAWRVRRMVTPSVRQLRWHGSLDAIVDSERRPLRSIGTTAAEVASRTAALLGELLAVPGVRIFRGVRLPDASLPPTTHAVAAGHSLVLVESVALPPGAYRTDADGRIRCNDVYIGQSVAPLVATVRRWRQALPRGHRVSALVVMHRAAPGGYVLPESPDPGLVWTMAEDAAAAIRARLPVRQSMSTRAFAALVAATADPDAG